MNEEVEVPQEVWDSAAEIMQSLVQRKPPSHPDQVVTLLDKFSRTRAAPKRNGLHMESLSDSIGSYLSPQASVLKFDTNKKEVVWKMEAFEEQNDKAMVEPPKLKARVDYVSAYKDMRIVENSQLHQEIMEANITVNQFWETWHRFNVYCSKEVPLSAIAEIKEGWLNNIDFLVQAHKYEGLPKNTVNNMLDKMTLEIRNEYIKAARRAVVEYIFTDPIQRERCGVLFVPNARPYWGSIPYVGPEGTEGGAPKAWRPALETQRRQLLKKLTCLNMAALKANIIWTTKYSHLRLFIAPPEDRLPCEIDEFLREQQEIRDRTREALEMEWSQDIADILAAHPFLDGRADFDTEVLFFRSFATLLARQLRTCVENSINDFVAFMNRYSNPSPPDAFQVRDQDDHTPLQPSFLLIKATIKGHEVRFRTVLDSLILAPLLKAFSAIVGVLRDLPRPDTEQSRNNSSPFVNTKANTTVNGFEGGTADGDRDKNSHNENAIAAFDSSVAKRSAMAAATAAQGSPHLRYISEGEQIVTQSRELIEEIVERNLANAQASLQLFEPYTWILTEMDVLRAKLEKSPNYSREDLKKDIMRLRQAEAEMRATIPFSVRLQMITVSMSDVLEAFTAKFKQCEELLFNEVSERCKQETIRILKTFETKIQNLKKRPILTEAELVAIDNDLENFKATEQDELIEEYKDQLKWMRCIMDLEGRRFREDDYQVTLSVAHQVRSASSVRALARISMAVDLPPQGSPTTIKP